MSKQKRPKQTAQPKWQPIAMLDSLVRHVSEMLQADEDQFALLRQARAGSLDNYTVQRVLNVYQEREKWLGIYDEQFARWGQEPGLNEGQMRQIEQGQEVMRRERRLVGEVLELARSLKGQTIEAIMGKSDAEIGLDFLMGKYRH